MKMWTPASSFFPLPQRYMYVPWLPCPRRLGVLALTTRLYWDSYN